MKTIALVSGLDSYVAYRLMKDEIKDITPVYFNYGQEFTNELTMLSKVVDLTVLKVESFTNASGLIPDFTGRDTLLSLYCVTKLGADRIISGCLPEDGFRDNTVTYFYHLNSILSTIGGKSVEVLRPFHDRRMNKGDVISWALKNGISPKVLMSLPTCMSGEYACQVCSKCINKWFHFVLNDLEYPMFSSTESIEKVVEYLLVDNQLAMKAVSKFLGVPINNKIGLIEGIRGNYETLQNTRVC